MAYDMESSITDNPVNLKYDDGSFQIKRVDDIQKLINICKINPTTYNQEFNAWNFEIWFNCLNALLDEIWNNLNDLSNNGEEKASVSILRKRVMDTVFNFSILEDKKPNQYTNKKISIVNKERWQKLYELLILYDNYIKEIMYRIGWNNHKSKNEEDKIIK